MGEVFCKIKKIPGPVTDALVAAVCLMAVAALILLRAVPYRVPSFTADAGGESVTLTVERTDSENYTVLLPENADPGSIRIHDCQRMDFQYSPCREGQLLENIEYEQYYILTERTLLVGRKYNVHFRLSAP